MLEARKIEEISIGDYVLSGGELAAQVLIDAACGCCPALPATRARSPRRASRYGLLEYPHYTRPREFEGHAIPEVLLSGDHQKIAEWRREQAEKLTQRAPARFMATRRQDRTLIEVRSSLRLRAINWR